MPNFQIFLYNPFLIEMTKIPRINSPLQMAQQKQPRVPCTRMCSRIEVSLSVKRHYSQLERVSMSKLVTMWPSKRVLVGYKMNELPGGIIPSNLKSVMVTLALYSKNQQGDKIKHLICILRRNLVHTQ